VSHHLDIDGILEKLILLQHFSAGSRSYCAERVLGSELDQGDGEFDEYWGWLKGIVCASTLECSIKFRVLLDSTTGEVDQKLFDALDQKARSGLLLGAVMQGNFELTLRELSNKIIHATHVIPEWERSTTEGIEFKFWSGTLELSGNRNGKPWCLRLCISSWARAMQQFLSYSESEEAFRYVGQDWFPKTQA
jgi:hypothetical protein